MPINTVHTVLYNLLNGLVIPGTAGTLDAYLTPPDPRDEPPPSIYLWPSRGNEARWTLPRAPTAYLPLSQSGWKQLTHSVDGYLTWFGENDPPDSDVAFPAVVDAVMQALRSCTDPMLRQTDPLTGQQSDLYGIGENLVYDLLPHRTVAAERYIRYDAVITIQVREGFQA